MASNLEILETAIQKFYPELVGLEVEEIGEGSYAKAYRVGELAFKFTRDGDDAKASVRVKGLDLNHIVKVYRVFKLAPNQYLIVSRFVPIKLIDTDKYKEMNRFLDNIHSMVTRYIYRNMEGEEKEDFTKLNSLKPEIQQELVTFLHELRDNNFSNADIHYGNIGVDTDGKFKLFDLGHLTSRNKSKVEITFEELV